VVKAGLNVERAAIVEITSEDRNFPVESAFASGETQGWRAAMAGAQTIRLNFRSAAKAETNIFVFEEKQTARTRIRLTPVFRRRDLISINCAPTVELQPS
jgi:hypothetical protein